MTPLWGMGLFSLTPLSEGVSNLEVEEEQVLRT